MTVTSAPYARPGRGREALWLLVGGAAAGGAALALGSLGMMALYGLVALLVLGAAGYGLRQDLVPPLAGAVDRVRPSRWRTAGPAPRSRLPVTAGAGIACAALAFVGASVGLTAVAGVVGLVMVAVLAALLWPLIVNLLTAEPEDVPARPARPARAARLPGTASRRRGAPEATVVAAVVLGVGVLAFLMGTLGKKGLIAVVGGLAVTGLLVFVRDRSVFFTFAAVCSLTLVLHKSLGPQDLELSGGAVSIYVTSFDAMLLVLYGLWAAEGTLVADLRTGLRRPIVWLPAACALLLLPSLLIAPSVGHAASELFRMGWMYLLYVYVAVRVRTRRHVWAVLGGLAVFAAIELIVVVLQWRTGGVLGLSFLGVPTQLTERTTDTGALGRPFGTVIHPVFMGAALGSVGLLAIALAVELRRSVTKIAAVALIAACFLPLYLAHTRASLVAALPPALAVLVAGLVRGAMSWRTAGRLGLIALAGVIAFLPQLADKFSENFGTAHFYEEIASRLQLNDIAYRMIHDHWGLGVGLNNFEVVMPEYQPYFVIFANNPVHNLYLLYLAEAGVPGLIAIAVVGIALLAAALRLARSVDRLYAGIGIGVAGAMTFLMIEELLGFSLRQDIPLALYWLLAGLVAACLRLAKLTPATGPSKPGPATRRPGPWARAWGWTRGRPWGRRRRVPATVAVLLGTAASTLVAQSSEAAVQPRITFEAKVRATGESAVFTANGDGSGVTRISPQDGRVYRWPRWAFGGTKIVYTAREATQGAPEAIELMNPDGSGRQVIQSFAYTVGQPMVEPAGTHLIFTAVAPWFPKYAIFRMDLRTGLSTNLSGVAKPLGAGDTDPAILPGGRQLLFTTAAADSAPIEVMNVDGTSRTQLARTFFNTDASGSPDGRSVVTSSYRGPDTPQDDNGDVGSKTEDFLVVTIDRATGRERVLTSGENCAQRLPSRPCTVPEMSGYIPRYSPDGRDVLFTGALDSSTTCICAIGADGAGPRTIVASTTLAINWLDIAQPSGQPVDTGFIGSDRPRSRVLLTTAPTDGSTRLVDASPDLMHRTPVPLPPGLRPTRARWSPDRRQLAFVADVPVPGGQSHPQVFLRRADGSVRPVTPPTDVSNTDPAFTPDGRALLVTNVSAAGESSVLRIDLVTGAALNLTKATSGAPAGNTGPVVSADGALAAFSGGRAGRRDIYVMDARTGTGVRAVTADAAPDTAPAWLPDGSGLVYVTRAAEQAFVVRTTVAGGNPVVLTRAGQGPAAPVADPAGATVLFVGNSASTRGVYAVDAAGSRPPRLVQPDPRNNVTFVDWR